MTTEPVSKYNINIARDVHLLGEEHHVAFLTKLLGGFVFLNPRAGPPDEARRDLHFVVIAVDLTQQRALAALAQTMAALAAPSTHKIVFALAPPAVGPPMRLYCQELGARFVASGPGRNDDLKDHLKRICLEAHQVGSLEAYGEELGQAVQVGDRLGTRRVLEKLRAIQGESEELLRLLATGSMQLGEGRRAQSYLKRLLTVNPQNLWAANTLGRLLLSSGRGAEGIETLEKLSRFHDLNPERMLVIGDAYASAGLAREAEAHYAKGDKLTEGQDGRFKTGMAKVALLDGNFENAVRLLGQRELSVEAMAFLNMRAIIESRRKAYPAAIQLYRQAIAGCRDELLKAKVLFNMGLALIRAGDLNEARQCLEASASAGGKKFPRAQKPLEVVKAAQKMQAAGQVPAILRGAEEVDECEWETLY